jgi:hypothetical protein
MDAGRRLWHTVNKKEQSGIMRNPSSPPPRARGSRRLVGLGLASAAALVLVVVVGSMGSEPGPEVASVEAVTALPAPVTEPAAPAAAPRYAQQLGTTCRTATRVCPLPAALPIGSPCSCDGESGEVAP